MLRPLAWNVGFAVGHPEIDAQHRHLIVLINEIVTAVEQKALENLPVLLGVLRSAASAHFQAETAALHALRSGTHPGVAGRPMTPRLSKALAELRIDEHQAQHALLLDRLGGFRTLPPHTLCERLKEWFVDHAIRQDSRLRPVFQAI